MTNHWQHALYSLYSHPQERIYKVITNSNLTPTPIPSCKFSSILTETSLLNTETPISPIPHINLIEYYDQMFLTLNSYKNFMDHWLGIWEHDLQVKYFNSLYCHQQSTTNSIKTLHDQAPKLLEANRLQERKHSLQWEINHHLHTITQPKLRWHLYNPYKVQPWPPIPMAQPTQPIPSASWPTLHSNPNPRKQTVLHCFQCNSLTHIKWNCPQYCCQYCNDVAPSHSQQNCPKNRFETYNDGHCGHYNIGEKKMGIWMGNAENTQKKKDSFTYTLSPSHPHQTPHLVLCQCRLIHQHSWDIIWATLCLLLTISLFPIHYGCCQTWMTCA